MRASHQLAGSVGYFGSPAATAAARRVEEAARAASWAEAAAALADLDDVLARLAPELAALGSNGPTPSPRRPGDRTGRSATHVLVADWGYEVTAAADGSAAWDALRAADPP